jgi:crotonobetainyl-CoA:carnitine CoA-transferase CaiB-like acyl-CoA transferase
LINSKVLIEKLRTKKIPAGFIQNLKEVFELPQAREMLLTGGGVLGVRNYVGRDAGFLKLDAGLLPPPHLGEHTEEVVSALNI